MYFGLSAAHLLNASIFPLRASGYDFASCSKTLKVSFQSICSAMSNIYEEAKVVSVNTENPRYDVYDVVFPAGAYGCDEPMSLTYSTNKEGHYIGDLSTAQHLCDKLGIYPELAKPEHRTCSIGKSDVDNKWYGWSHRAMCGFNVGSEVYPGHCAYKSDSMEEFKREMYDWYSDGMYNDLKLVVESNGIRVSYKIVPQGKGRENALPQENFHEFTPGRGTWIAKNMSDARQMACDFAMSVSSVSVEDVIYADSNVKFESESANPQDVTKFLWYRYNQDRKTTINAGNNEYNIALEKGDKFGIKQQPKKPDNYYLISAEDVSIVFALDRSTMERAVRRSVGFSGKVSGMKVSAGNPDIAKRAVIKEVKAIKQDKVFLDEQGLPVRYRQVIQDAVWCAVFASGHVRRGYLLVIGKSERAVKGQVNLRSDCSEPATIMQLPKSDGLVQRALKTGWTRLSEAQAGMLREKGTSLKQFIPMSK